eukprot:5254924-Amphidinium_carterae.1
MLRAIITLESERVATVTSLVAFGICFAFKILNILYGWFGIPKDTSFETMQLASGPTHMPSAFSLFGDVAAWWTQLFFVILRYGKQSTKVGGSTGGSQTMCLLCRHRLLMALSLLASGCEPSFLTWKFVVSSVEDLPAFSTRHHNFDDRLEGYDNWSGR